MKPDMKIDRYETERNHIAFCSSLSECLHVQKWYEIHNGVDFISVFLTDLKFSTSDMNCSAHICSTGLQMKTLKMIIVSLKVSFIDCSKGFFNHFVNNDLLQILWTYVNFYNRTGHMTQMFSYTKHKINFPFSWVFRSKNSNFSPIFFSFKTNICFIKNWFWQFDKELSSFNQ